MSSQLQDEVEPAVRYSRRSLWFALAVVLLLGAAAVLTARGGDTTLFSLLPVLIVIGAAALGRPGSGPEMKALASDELRQFSLGHAWRNGFLAVLVVQPLLAWQAASPSLMATVTATAGVLAVLASLLWYDR